MNKKTKSSWVKVPALVLATFVVIIASQDAFAETEVTIPNEAADISCAESGSWEESELILNEVAEYQFP